MQQIISFSEINLTPIAFAIGACMFLAVFVCLLPLSFKKSRSKDYRELLTDMYVVGMIKKFADEDKIDLAKELKEYARIMREQRLSRHDLDVVVEQHLKEKIIKVSEEKVSKKGE